MRPAKSWRAPSTARWLGVECIVRANPLIRDEQARIVAHINRDHADALRAYLATADGNNDTDGVTMLGIDAEGIDLGWRMDSAAYR